MRNDSHYNIREILYSYNLLYRASRDGYSASSFHNKCDNKGVTIVIVKIKGSEQIVGGYNPFDWDSSSSHKTTKDSFIFAFTDKMNTKTANVGYSNGVMSVGSYPSCGPVFGNYFYFYNDGTTWYIKDDNYSISYSSIGIPTGSVKVDDCEIFKVTKK